MADYFLLLNGAFFETVARPALAESWRQRSFTPCQGLCASLVPAARDYATQYHVGAGEPLLALVAGGLPFERTRWRFLVSEVLLFGAVEIPELQTSPQTLCCLLAPGHYRNDETQRPALAPIQQAHLGSRDL